MTTIEQENRRIIGQLYQQIRQEVFSIFRQACIAEDTCEDMVQEVFMKIMCLDVIIEDQLKGMAIKMAYQKRVDYLRHRAIKNKVHDSLAWQMERSYANTDAEVHDILSIEQSVMDHMSEKDCEIYRMTRFEDKTADEIVLETGLSKRAVESRIYRTRNLVRDGLRQAIGM
jgi:RNA polymerase sigma factor (sigma-70 family)